MIWLAFPESDRCFATIEKRMLGLVDLSGKEYALVTKEKGPDNWARSLITGHHLIARLVDSPYGDLSVLHRRQSRSLKPALDDLSVLRAMARPYKLRGSKHQNSVSE